MWGGLRLSGPSGELDGETMIWGGLRLSGPIGERDEETVMLGGTRVSEPSAGDGARVKQMAEKIGEVGQEAMRHDCVPSLLSFGYGQSQGSLYWSWGCVERVGTCVNCSGCGRGPCVGRGRARNLRMGFLMRISSSKCI